jgi:hypothetical protein
MGADHDVGLAVKQFRLGQRQFLGADQARSLGDPDRIAAQALGERS